MGSKKYDFSGWATKNDIRCSDGRIIKKDAFKNCNGMIVPLVWNHDHTDPSNIVGHALLENRDEGVYTYCSLNDTDNGKVAKELVSHGDIAALSIYANHLKESNNNVLHGAIREVSLVLAGANPGALIQNVIKHGEFSDDEAIIYTPTNLELNHSDENKNNNSNDSEESEVENQNGKSIQEVIDSMTEEQKEVLYDLVGNALNSHSDNNETDSEGGNEIMKHNLFENDGEAQVQNTLSHSELQTIFKDAKRTGSLKDAFMMHSEEYGITNLEYLFPDATLLDKEPQFISRDMTWVQTVINGIKHSPFSRIKSVFADITENDARAKGYIKGKLKKEEVFALLKRTTQPTTIYKKQKMDRDDIIDITDLDVVAYIRSEMRMMLDEEIARAVLLGDGRLQSSEDKIDENCIRPIWKDEDLFTVKSQVKVKAEATDEDIAREFITQCIKSRKLYKGSGQPSLFTTEDMVTNMLLLTDSTGRDLYDSVEKLKTKLRVKEIITVEPMEGAEREATVVTASGSKLKKLPLLGIVVNLADYTAGADKGGAISMFDDFDIDYNQQKYLIETRCSGSLTKPYSAIALELNKAEE